MVSDKLAHRTWCQLIWCLFSQKRSGCIIARSNFIKFVQLGVSNNEIEQTWCIRIPNRRSFFCEYFLIQSPVFDTNTHIMFPHMCHLRMSLSKWLMITRIKRFTSPSSFMSPTINFSAFVSPRNVRPSNFLTTPRAPPAPTTHSYFDDSSSTFEFSLWSLTSAISSKRQALRPVRQKNYNSWSLFELCVPDSAG